MSPFGVPGHLLRAAARDAAAWLASPSARTGTARSMQSCDCGSSRDSCGRDVARLISVVIPCYNQGHFLRRGDRERACRRRSASRSIVVDDGSTDDTGAVAAHSRHVRSVTQANRGLAAARNRGLEAATGDFVIFLDADDRLLPGGDRHRRARAGRPSRVRDGLRPLHDDGSRRRPSGPRPSSASSTSDHYASLLRPNRIWMPAMAIFRREALVAAGGFRPGSTRRPTTTSTCASRAAHRDPRSRPLVAAYRRHAASMSGNARACCATRSP